MPTYEYRCPDGHDFELFQKMTDKPRAKCPVCGKPATRQISGGAGLHFKGSGFYITDYGKDGKGPRKPETSAESGSSAAEASEKTDKTAKTDGTDKPTSTDKPTKADKPAKSDKPDAAAKPAGKKAKP
ncbi:MAG TPA: zinc ribbon domain-containing protein [Gemmatimonadales bacterium]|nr:zinc ribbon domain-containing protein [Gemmatimonadales bacterium]